VGQANRPSASCLTIIPLRPPGLGRGEERPPRISSSRGKLGANLGAAITHPPNVASARMPRRRKTSPRFPRRLPRPNGVGPSRHAAPLAFKIPCQVIVRFEALSAALKKRCALDPPSPPAKTIANSSNPGWSASKWHQPQARHFQKKKKNNFFLLAAST